MNFDLEEIGLTKGEIKVYLALAEHGNLGKSELSIKSKVSSSKIYEIAEKLVDKGLVGRIKKDGKTIYQINNPDTLMKFIEEREKKIIEEKEIVKKAIPLIKNMGLNKDNSRFEIFEGNEGLKKCVNELLEDVKNNEEICGFGIEAKNIGLLHQYHRERTLKNVKQRFIFSDRNIHWTDYKRKNNRFIEDITDIGIAITNKKILLVSQSKKPVTLVIEHPEFNKSFKQIFEKLWSIAKK
jgi:sugar-specific transcriptional regulator TrmB